MDGSPATPPTSRSLDRLSPRMGHVLAVVVLVGALALVFTAWNAMRTRELRAAEAAFISQTDAVAELLRQRLVHYELVIRGGASMFASLTRPTPAQWGAYAEGMDLTQRFPALAGLGFAAYVSNGRLDDLQLQWRDSGFGKLEVFPRGVREAYGPVLYLEPRSAANLTAVGFDMYSEPTRRAAMDAAVASGELRLTGPVQLVQDAHLKTTGLLLYLPVYRGVLHPTTPSARWKSVEGWVYVPFRMRPFVAASLGKVRPDARFRIYDVTNGDEVLLFTNAYAPSDEPPAFRYSRVISQYGREWRLDFDSPPLGTAAPRLQVLQNMLVLGIFASLLMFAVAWMLAQTEARARTIALRLTEDYRRSEQRFRAALEHSAIGKALLDSNGRIVEVNPAFATTVGRTQEELSGRLFTALFEQSEAESGSPTPPDGTVHRSMRRLQCGDGVLRHVQLTYSPVPGNVGQDISRLVHVEDVTERLRSEARIHALNRTLEARVALRTRELSQANEELESFAYSVSHDLRAPLRAIDGFSRILMERYGAMLDDTGRDYLGRVRRGASRMGDLIDAMLKMSRLSRGELKLETVDLSRIATEAADELQAQEPQRVVEWRIQPGLEVLGDATLLRNLLDNLLGNAWKFTRECESAVIEFGRSGQEESNEFHVRDNGVGFSQDYVDKLFRPFQRLHAQEHFSGHGIGLATVKRIVERHGGTIRAQGAEGQGATFYFTLRAEHGAS